MAGARHGVIVNIGSSSALSARPGQVNYGEIARAVAFFASDAGRCYSGQTIVIDGGRTAYEQEFGL